MKRISLFITLLLALVSLVACGNPKGWATYNGELGFGSENVRTALFLKNQSEITDENRVTGDITLLPTEVENVYIIYSIDLNILEDFQVVPYGQTTPKTGGLRLENGNSTYSNSEIVSYIVHPTVKGEEQEYFSLDFVDRTDPENTIYTLEHLEWKINLTMDIKFEFTYPDAEGVTKTFTYTIVASEIKKGN